jgi:site-specific recombinase XerD
MSRETTSFLKNYQHHLHELGLSQLTIQSYCADLERFRGWFGPARGRAFAKNLIDQGVSLDRVNLLLGHASLDTTRIYTKPTEADLAREVEKLVIG